MEKEPERQRVRIETRVKINESAQELIDDAMSIPFDPVRANERLKRTCVPPSAPHVELYVAALLRLISDRAKGL